MEVVLTEIPSFQLVQQDLVAQALLRWVDQRLALAIASAAHCGQWISPDAQMWDQPVRSVAMMSPPLEISIRRYGCTAFQK